MRSLDVICTRGPLVESRHRVHAAVVNATGDLVASVGNPALVTYWRSCAKPFQVMPLIARGGFDRIGWGDDQLALACGLPVGRAGNVAIADGNPAALGLEGGDIAGGPAAP